ncbi:MAG: hypothetical protein FJ044_01165 [Candidatus Cloacimonetes bacterium]|nr:hypothetical protein [Candidatus Cloacimonadota bacterium]
METIYLETSVPSAYFDIRNEDPKRKAITRKFWTKILPSFKVYTSVLVIRELGQVEESLAPKFLELISGIEQLPITKEAEELAGKYVIGGHNPQK